MKNNDLFNIKKIIEYCDIVDDLVLKYDDKLKYDIEEDIKIEA